MKKAAVVLIMGACVLTSCGEKKVVTKPVVKKPPLSVQVEPYRRELRKDFIIFLEKAREIQKGNLSVEPIR
ncbi:hypothetical protein [Desulfurobacterium sp.]|uniref:hypothetical protein n=1 Tax=Desulfurobacterium sp. TaxID=2004706 RepID=UPI002607BE09|nr:hypothetical protein [Desulfurobacterium sp.]